MDKNVIPSGEEATLRVQAEKALQAKLPPASNGNEDLSPEESRRMLHELRVHQIELEMQNEELRRTQAELENSRARYFDLYDLAPVGYVTISEEGLILEANLAFASMLGTGRCALPRLPFTQYIAKDDQETYYLLHKRSKESCEPQACVLRMTKADGSVFWARLEAITVRDADGAPVNRVAISDITEQKQVEDALLRSEKRFQEVTSSIPGAVCQFVRYTDGTVEIPFLSEGARDLFERPLEELTDASRLFDDIPPDDLEGMWSSLAESAGSMTHWEREFRIITKTSEMKWLIGSSNPIALQDGGVCWNGIIMDITSRKRMEEDLRRKQAMLTRTESIAHLGSWEWDVTTDIVTWSNELFRIFQRNPEDGAPSFAEHSLLYHPEDMRKLENVVRKAVSEGIPYEIELRAIRKDGETRICLARGYPQRGSSNNVTHLYGSLQDITDYKRVEAALRESEERFQQMFDHMADGVAVYQAVDEGRDFIFVDLNKTGQTVSNVRLEEIIGKRVTNVFPAAKKIGLLDVFRRVWLTGLPEHLPLSEYLDGRICQWVENYVYKMPSGMIAAIYSDSTEMHKAEEEMENLQAQLQQAQKMESVGRLAGGVAHDFNNMLNVIIGHAELVLEQMDIEQPLHSNLMEILNAATRSADLTRQLLAFARKQAIAPKLLDLNETVEGMLKMLRRLIGEDIDLSWSPMRNLWRVKVDPSQIDQILANLCVNSRDAIAGTGRITIETRNSIFDAAYCTEHPGFTPGEYTQLTVSDDGCGMEKETLALIFEPFFTTKEIGKGTGLGLATVYGIVKQNDGFLDVASTPGAGTAFTIYLPRHMEIAGAERIDDTQLPASRGDEVILLVEDEHSVLMLTLMILQRLGYTVLAANTPSEAIRLAKDHTCEIHLLITDVVMPEMNGPTLAKHLLSLHPRLKRLFMSGYTPDTVARHGLLEDGVNFIQKPFSRKELAAKIREALDKE